MTTNDRWTARAGQLTVSAFIHRALTRAGISLVVAATFAAASAQAQEGGTTAQQAPAGAPKQPEETKNQADTLKPKKLIRVAANGAAAPASAAVAAAEPAKQPAGEATAAGPWHRKSRLPRLAARFPKSRFPGHAFDAPMVLKRRHL